MPTVKEHTTALRLLRDERGPETPFSDVAHLIDRVESLELQVQMLATLVEGKQDRKRNDNP